MIENGISGDKIRVIPETLTRRFPLIRKEDDIFRIIVVGSVNLRKGGQYVLEAASKLKLPNSEVVLIGPVSEEFRPVLKRYEGQFVLAGPVSEAELARHFSRASVLVLASLEDGWGHVTLEAMSCGLPVIVSVNTGSADAVQDGVNGFVVPVCDTSAIIEKLECLYLSRGMREEMGARNRACTSIERTWTDYGEEVTEFFRVIGAQFSTAPFNDSFAQDASRSDRRSRCHASAADVVPTELCSSAHPQALRKYEYRGGILQNLCAKGMGRKHELRQIQFGVGFRRRSHEPVLQTSQ